MRLCSICREGGHRKETCPSRGAVKNLGAYAEPRATSGPEYNKPLDEEVVREIIRLKTEDEMRPTDIARETGISISSVLRTLSRNGISHRMKVKRAGPPLSRQQYFDVQISREHGMNSGDVARLMGVDLGEVNAAWSTREYDRYLERR